MASILRAHAWHIHLRPVIAGAIAATAAVVWLPAAAHGASVAEPDLAVIAALDSGRASDSGIGNDSAPPPRTEAPVFVLSGGRFITFDAPEVGSNHFPRINNRGDVVGEYIKTDGGGAGGFLRERRGRITEIAYPAAAETIPLDINDRRQIVGNYHVVADGPLRAFQRDRHGRFRPFQAPGAAQTQAYAISNRGDIAGDYTAADGTIHGYRWHNGRFTTIDGPNGTGATLTDINDRGDMLGVFAPTTDPADGIAGFLLRNGRYTTITVPDALYTIPTGINNRGHIVGSTFDALKGATTEAHGFLLRDGADGPFTPIDIPGAIVGTNATGINDRGQIVGRYGNANPATNQPVPDMTPTSTMSGISQASDTGVTLSNR